MNGYDVMRYNTLLSKCQNLNIKLVTRGEALELKTDEKSYGVFDTIQNCLFFIEGLEWGLAEGSQ